MNDMELIRKYQDTGCIKARNKVVVNNIPLIQSMVYRYHGTKDQIEELIQQGVLGLINAIEKFDLSLGYKLSTYAAWHIKHMITHYIYSNTGHINFIRNNLDFAKIYRYLPIYYGVTTKDLDIKDSSINDIAKGVNLPKKTVERFFELFLSSHSGSEYEYRGTASNPEELYLKEEQEERLSLSLLNLPRDIRTIVLLNYIGERTCKDIGENLFCRTGPTIAGNVRKGLALLRKDLVS